MSRLSISNSSHAPREGMIFAEKTSLSEVLSAVRSKYTPGERTSCDTTTRSVPLMTNVPRSVMSGKSPMKTVWLLISPVVVFMNSAVTKSGAEYVMSRSLHSSIEYLGGSKRWSRNDSDMEPEKSSIGEISSKISSRPEVVGTSCRPLGECGLDTGLPLGVTEEPVEALRLQGQEVRDLQWLTDLAEGDTAGRRTGGRIEEDAVREAAKRGPSTGLRALRAHAEVPTTSAWVQAQGRAQRPTLHHEGTACLAGTWCRLATALSRPRWEPRAASHLLEHL